VNYVTGKFCYVTLQRRYLRTFVSTINRIKTKMKNRMILLIVVAAAIMTNAQAQGDRSKLYFGLKGGVNYANVYDTEGEQFEADAKFGFVGGAFLSIPLGKVIGFQPEILFSQKGFQGTGVMFGTPYSMTRTTNYIDVPLLFSLKPVSAISLIAGPQFSYLVKQKDTFTNGAGTAEQVEAFDNDNIRRNTLCFLGGIDFNLNNLVLGTRVGWDIQSNNGDGTSTTPRYRNRWVQATLGFRF
jgi:hypothetical protein